MTQKRIKETLTAGLIACVFLACAGRAPDVIGDAMVDAGRDLGDAGVGGAGESCSRTRAGRC